MERKPALSLTGSRHYRLLWLIASVSLVSTLLLIGYLYVIGWRVTGIVEGVAQVAQAAPVESLTVPFETETTIVLSHTLSFNQSVPISSVSLVPLTIPLMLSETIQVPLSGSLPLRGSIPTILGSIPFSGNALVSETLQMTMTSEAVLIGAAPFVLNLDAPLPIEAPINSSIPVRVQGALELPADSFGLRQIRELLLRSLLTLAGPGMMNSCTIIAALLIAIALAFVVGMSALGVRRRALPGTTEHTARPHIVAAPRATLTVISGEARLFQTLALYGDTRVGRSRQHAQLIFQEDVEGSPISRLHCTFLDRQDHFALRDEDSLNGTFLNDKRLTPGMAVRLHDDDVIELGRIPIGGIKLRFNLAATPASELPTELDLPAPDDV